MIIPKKSSSSSSSSHGKWNVYNEKCRFLEEGEEEEEEGEEKKVREKEEVNGKRNRMWVKE